MHDYVSPTFTTILDPSKAFPYRVQGYQRTTYIGEIERTDPHNWEYDERWPPTGFVNKDEAHILYHLARQFRYKNALEIGCHVGFSAWHLLKAGVNLSICDPILFVPEVRKAVIEALAEFRGAYHLTGFPSPQAALELGGEHGPWSFCFIDALHHHPYPLLDAIAAAQLCAQDAMIIFHDAIIPAVYEAVGFLQICGWQLKIYDTSQMLAVCYRGDVELVDHIPDDAIRALPIPNYLEPHVPR
jgi:predicted O-methyltransferase YrrM